MILIQCCASGSARHNFGNLDPQTHQIKIRIRIKVFKLDPEPDPDPLQSDADPQHCLEQGIKLFK